MTADAALTHDRFLGGRLRLWQPRGGYRAGTDPVLMAAAVPVRASEDFLELGCGVGTAALCLAYRCGAAGVGLEMQPQYAALARQNARESGLALEVVEGDVHAMPAEIKARSFHHVMLNPPYFSEVAGTPAADVGRDIALRDRSDLAEWLDAAARRVRPKGSLTVIVRADRLRQVLAGLPEVIGTLRVLPLSARRGRPAKRVLVQGIKEGRGPLILLPPFILHEGSSHSEDGDDFTSAAARILREGAALDLHNATG
ncbi:tRNA1(Val) (adenine(37)-N6)-methyltransferase [Tropicimonas sp. S265A]|uniref:tRNA1(Val) (adenine(37)-N6)-methyltransferase n=1 Tax=Tropicimonas sp. S265A TaxID=3415134 RepID=UPI003C7EA958